MGTKLPGPGDQVDAGQALAAEGIDGAVEEDLRSRLESRRRAPSGDAPGGKRLVVQVAIWVLEWNPSLARMLATCRATVAGLR